MRMSQVVVVSTIALGLAANPAAAQEGAWTFSELGSGIKPAIAVDGDNVPHVSFLTEAIMGAVFYASNISGAWQTETVAQGYFYGPVDIDVTRAGVPHVVYHDHEAAQFNQSLGAGVLQIKNGSGWDEVRISDAGHDQWDADVAVEDSGIWHFAGIDPSQFGSESGLEYITNAFGDPRVEKVGSGAIPYEFGVSVEVGGGGVVGISYYDAPKSSLMFAERGAGENGSWAITLVQSDGDSGRYSDLAYDPEGNPHLSYWVFKGANDGVVRHAWRGADGAWQIEDVGELSAVEPGFVGARKITALELANDGTPQIMYGDEEKVVYATRNSDGSWTNATVVEAGDRPLGQLVEFALDGNDQPHVTYFEVTQGSPLEGIVFYGTPGG